MHDGTSHDTDTWSNDELQSEYKLAIAPRADRNVPSASDAGYGSFIPRIVQGIRNTFFHPTTPPRSF